MKMGAMEGGRKPLIWSLAAAFVLLVMVLVWARTHFLGEASSLAGPRHLSIADQTLFLQAGPQLLRLQLETRQVEAIDLDGIGINGAVADIQAVDADHFIAGTLRPAGLFQCNFSDRICKPLVDPQLLPISGAFKFHLTAEQQLWLTDGRVDRIMLADLDAAAAFVQVSVDGQLNKPNRIRLAADGMLHVADTNYHRIASFHYDAAKTVLEPSGELSVLGHPQQRSQRVWPTDFVRDEAGNTWTLNGDGLLENADLLRFDAEGRPSGYVPLGEQADPVAMQLHGGSLYVADYAGSLWRVDRVSSEAVRVTSVDAYLARVRDQKQRYLQRGRLALYLLLGIMVVAVLLAWRIQKRYPADSKITVVKADPPLEIDQRDIDDMNRVVWFEPLPAYVRQTRRAILAIWIVVALVPVALVPLNLFELGEDIGAKWAVGIGIPVILAASLAAFIPLFRQLIGIRLAVHGHTLLVDLGDGRVEHYAMEQTLFNERLLLLPCCALMLRDGYGRYLYDAGLIEKVLLPRLDQASKRARGFAVSAYMLRHRHYPMLLLIAIFTGLIIVYLLLEWFDLMS